MSDKVSEILTRPRKRSSQPRKQTKSMEFDIGPNKPLKLTEAILKFPTPDDIISVKVNGIPSNLNYVVKNSCGSKVKLKPIYTNSIEGEAILRRSYVFMMGKAMYDMDKKRRNWHCEHQLANAYFCQFDDSEPPTKEFLEKLKAKMLEISKQSLPILEEKLYYDDAVNHFKKANMSYTVKLLQSVNMYEVPVDLCGKYMQLHHRVMVHNTKVLNNFDLVPHKHGWAINFTFSRKRFNLYYQAREMNLDRVVEINKERNDFVESIGVDCVGDINRMICNHKIEDFISLNNSFQDMVMNSMIRRIHEAREKSGCRLILIAGPSASGKTTFAKKMSWNLMCKGYKCYTLSVDNYYVMRENNPKDENGEYDFECLEALRIKKLNEDILSLFSGKETWIPKFDMRIGAYEDKGKKMKIENDSFLIMEGIHCLNDKLTPVIDKKMKFKTFIGPFTPINLDDVNYISNKVIRLMRRAVRDKMHRNHSIQQTLKMWPQVLKGEHFYIFPFMNDADFIFNSALDYEINVLKPYVKPLLKAVKPTEKFFDVAVEMLEFLKKFEIIPYKYVPMDSLLQEFLGGHWMN